MFTGKEEQTVTFYEGAAMTNRWRKSNPKAIKGAYFSKKSLELLLNQNGSVGIRIYLGYNESGEISLVLVGATSEENDQIGEDYNCVDLGIPCPDRCGEGNILNGNAASM